MKKVIGISILILSLSLASCGGLPNDPSNITANVTNTVSTNTTIDSVMGADNISHRLNITSDGQLVVNTETVFQEISMHGELEGKTAYNFHIMGRRAGFASTTTFNDIKEFDISSNATFPALTGVEALEVVSSSVNDNIAGTGARTVEVMYLDSSNNLTTSSLISMNGTSPVPAGFTANFIISMEVMSLGTSEVSEGNIVLRTVAGSVIQEQITAGGNRSLSSHFMIPVNYTGYLVSWEGTSITTSGAAQQQDVRIRATVDDEGNLSTVYHFLDNMFLSSGGVSPQRNLPYIKLPALTKIKASTISTSLATTARVDVSYHLFIVHN